jgi:hypothetical protein
MRRLLVLAGLLAVACGTSFDPASKVTKPRVLGIVASLPEATFDDDVTLEGVLGLPKPDPSTPGPAVASLAWSVCPLSLGGFAGYACADPSLELPVPAADASGATAVLHGAAFAAGLAQLEPFFPQLLEGLRRIVSQETDACLWDMLAAYDACAAAGTAPQDCLDVGYATTVACLRTDGFDVQARLVVTLDDGTSFEAVKRVLFRDPDPDRPPNTNPVVTGLDVWPNVEREGPSVHVSPGDVLTVPAGWVVSFVPVLAEGSVEALPAGDPALDLPGATGHETVYFSWFATEGRFAYERTTADVPDTTWDAPALDELPDWPVIVAAPAWVFARDDRLGASCFAFSIAVVTGGETNELKVVPGVEVDP